MLNSCNTIEYKVIAFCVTKPQNSLYIGYTHQFQNTLCINYSLKTLILYLLQLGFEISGRQKLVYSGKYNFKRCITSTVTNGIHKPISRESKEIPYWARVPVGIRERFGHSGNPSTALSCQSAQVCIHHIVNLQELMAFKVKTLAKTFTKSKS